MAYPPKQEPYSYETKKIFLKILGAIIGILLKAGAVTYFAWFQNPYEHTMQLDPFSVYADHGEGYVITKANIVDMESGNAYN